MHSELIVLKFGGTSVSTLKRWQTIAQILREKLKAGLKPVVVCSALSQISNTLERAIMLATAGQSYDLEFSEFVQKHDELLKSMEIKAPAQLNAHCAQLKTWLQGIYLLNECSHKKRAQILALGELCSTLIGHAFLRKRDIYSQWLDARDFLVGNDLRTKSECAHYLNNSAPCSENREVKAKFLNSKAAVIITQGFIGKDHSGSTILFGRGGSDTSAAYIAAQVGAVACEIWTDVPGLFTSNPRLIPNARLLKNISYKEAQEIATNGAKVLHPKSIAPLKAHGIPLSIKDTNNPSFSGTHIQDQKNDVEPGIKAIAINRPTQMVALESMEMWNQVGFISTFFSHFKEHGFSVNLISTSETNITVTVDRTDGDVLNFKALCAELWEYGTVKTKNECASISLIGSSIRSVLPKISSSLTVFEDYPIQMMTQAANDLSLTFVVNNEHADKIVSQLHELLFSESLSRKTFGPSWLDFQAKGKLADSEERPKAWWSNEQTSLLKIAKHHSPVFVYNLAQVQSQIEKLKTLTAIDKVYYAIKANPKPEILNLVERNALGFECVSQGEIEHVLNCFPNINGNRILFTPNFAPPEEYEFAFSKGCHVTLDSLEPLKSWPALFQNKKVILRLDPGKGAGHHKHVVTAGNQSKFGICLEEIDDTATLLESVCATVVGLHAHAGSGISDPAHWKQIGIFLSAACSHFKETIQFINLGGGLSIPYKPQDKELNLEQLNDSLHALKKILPNTKLWMEPGRFISAQCGVLLTSVNQVKLKGDINYVGVNTGMNSLLRPSLYGAYHHIENLSRYGEAKDMLANIVGPICETGDTLGFSRSLPKSEIGDVILIENTGAYGRVMSSNYNLRPPADEIIL